MAVPPAPVLASAAVNGLLLIVFAVVGFAVVAGIAAVILALLQAVLPSGDTGADALHRAEQQRQEQQPVEPHIADPDG
jgi:hypothetical protein